MSNKILICSSNSKLNLTSALNNFEVNNHQKTALNHEQSSTITINVKTSNSTTVTTKETITIDSMYIYYFIFNIIKNLYIYNIIQLLVFNVYLCLNY